MSDNSLTTDNLGTVFTGTDQLTIGSDTTTTLNNCGTLVATQANSQITWANTDTGLSSTGSWYYNSDTVTEQSELQKLSYNVIFGVDRNSLLKDHIKGIRKNKIIFNCEYDKDNNIIPYEFIMELIEEKKKFSLKVEISDLLTLCYTNFQFTKIENNLNFGDNCDFSKLKVKFKYDKILHENHKLSDQQVRSRKLKKILKDNE